jgi:hypothetical protein
MMPAALAINRAEAFALLDDGSIVHFSNMFDAFGDETDDSMEAVSAVAPLPDGKWMAINLTMFEGVATH